MERLHIFVVIPNIFMLLEEWYKFGDKMMI